jgi:CRISPR-associated protein Cas5h
MNNNVLTFNLYGKFAHFKKFYSNKSSLTYKLPPSTVIMGIIASILEEPRDSYYNWLNPKKSRIGVKILSSGYNHFECMNYLSNDEAHTQTRLELLTSRDKIICYKFTFYQMKKKNFMNLKKN